MKGVKIEVPPMEVHHHVSLPPIQWEPLVVFALIIGGFLFLSRKS